MYVSKKTTHFIIQYKTRFDSIVNSFPHLTFLIEPINYSNRVESGRKNIKKTNNNNTLNSQVKSKTAAKLQAFG